MLRTFNLNKSYHVKEVKYMIILFKYERSFGDETFQEEHITEFDFPKGFDPSKLGERFLWDVLLVERLLMAEDLRILEIEYVED